VSRVRYLLASKAAFSLLEYMLTGSRTLFINGLQRASGLSFTKQNTRLQALVWSEKERVIASPECAIELSKDACASGRIEETVKGIRKRVQGESETRYSILGAVSWIVQLFAEHRERHRVQLEDVSGYQGG
jgi:hypothetical protein